MAEGGIDRKADERMEFTTSKDVTVAPTFTDSKSQPNPYIHYTTVLGCSMTLIYCVAFELLTQKVQAFPSDLPKLNQMLTSPYSALERYARSITPASSSY